MNAVALAGIAVPRFDPPLGVPAVGAHIPVPRRASRAGDGVGPAHNADDQVPGGKPGPRCRLGHPAQRLVPDDETFLTGRRPPVATADDLQIGATDANRTRLDQDRPVTWRWFRHVGKRDRALPPGNDGDGAHGLTVAERARRPDAG
jgi:hypothetical protein